MYDWIIIMITVFGAPNGDFLPSINYYPVPYETKKACEEAIEKEIQDEVDRYNLVYPANTYSVDCHPIKKPTSI